MGAPPSVRCRDCFTCSTLIARWASKYLRRAMQVCLAVCLLEKISSSLSRAPWSSGFRISSVLIWKQSDHITFKHKINVCFVVMLQRLLSLSALEINCIFMVEFPWLRSGSHVVCPTRLTRRRSPSCLSKSSRTARKEKEMEKNMVAWQQPDACEHSSSHSV